MNDTQSVDLEIDESSFTGETTHFLKQSSAIEDENSLLLNNISFMGTFVCSGHGKVFWWVWFYC